MTSTSEALAQAREVLEAQSKMLEQIGESTLSYGVVIRTKGNDVIIAAGGEMVRAYKNPDVPVKAGQTVWLLPQTKQIVRLADTIPVGDVMLLKGVHEDSVEITNQGGESRIVGKGKFDDLKRGDRVLLDASRSVVVTVVEKAPEAKPKDIPNITWDMIGGHEEAKRLLREAIELPYLHPEIYAKYKKQLTKGILLHGTPGCGKTLLGKAVATAVGGGFLSIKGPEILDPYVGVAEAAVRNIFAQAKHIKDTTGKPAVIFIDEADAILSARGAGHGAGNMEHTIVPAFLTEMDGLAVSSAIVILSTNRAELLDPAIVRDGRIDYKVDVKRPTAPEAKEIFSIHMKGIPVHQDQSEAELIEFAVSLLYGEQGRKLPHSGALVAGTVDKASAHAIRRDIATGGKSSGLCKDDLQWAVNVTVQQELAA